MPWREQAEGTRVEPYFDCVFAVSATTKQVSNLQLVLEGERGLQVTWDRLSAMIDATDQLPRAHDLHRHKWIRVEDQHFALFAEHATEYLPSILVAIRPAVRESDSPQLQCAIAHRRSRVPGVRY